MPGIERNFSHRGVLEAKETEPLKSSFFSHFREIVEKKARLEAPESAELIVEIASEIDRQGIENFEVRRTPEADFPVTVVNVTRLFEKILAGKVPRREVAVGSDLAELATKPERRTTLFLPGISPPPVGHPFTLWDYVYQQAYADLPRLVGAWRRGETLPEIEVRVFGSANSDWGHVTPEWHERVKNDGFKAHGEQVADYIGEILPEVDYLRLDGISMGALVAMETLDCLSDDERAKMQVLLDNPADHQYKNRLLRVIRALQLPLGFGLDAARIYLTNPSYRQLYGGESGFLAKLNPFLSKKFDQSVPSEDFEQLALKKQVALSEALKIAQASPSSVDERVFVRKGISDVTTSTFGDVISLVSTKLKNWWHGQDKPFVRGDGKRLQFTVSAGHQRDNFMVQKWAKLLNRSQTPPFKS
ncbi:hypothetical protein KJZ63_02425 [Patescibacteria group bacterium]|nr:hypothetical protein [Patescibacteria group bacterium]